jgi:hypothetical protein
LRKAYLYLSLIFIVSCSGVPKNNEQVAVSGEQSVVTELVEVSSGQAPTKSAIAEPVDTGDLSDAIDSVSEPAEANQPDFISEESSELAEAVAEEESPSAEYVETFMFDEPQEIAEEPELRSTEIVMETLRPVEASPLEPELPVELASPSETKPPASTEQKTAQAVPPDFSPPVRESWRQPTAPTASPKDDPQPDPKDVEPEVRGSPPEERILQPDYPIVFSRVTRVTVGQLVEIPFRGRDWVFLGEVGARRGIAYDSRKLDPEGESFIFKVEAAGVYALKFYRQDFAHDLILNDHVQIIAGGAPETTGLGWFNPPTDHNRVVVEPRWPNFIEQPQKIESHAEQQPSRAVEEPAAQSPPAAQPPATIRPPAPARPPATAQPSAPARPPVIVAQASPTQPQNPPTPNVTPAPAPEPVSPDAILKQARDEFNAGRIASAITLLDQFCKAFPSGSDEAWWLYGQCFEANSPNRNMLSALEYYRRLVREYPQSSRLNEARRRISYLERYYINIQ